MRIKIKNEDTHNIQRNFGIYLIRCLKNNNLYVGSTKQNFRARFSNHCKFLSQNKLSNKKLQEDFKKYGFENFEFEILHVCFEEKDIEKYEQYYIDTLNPFYNITKNAKNRSRTNLGKKLTEEHKEKIRQKSKNFKHEDLSKIDNQNKQGGTILKLTNLQTGEIKQMLAVEAASFFNINWIQYYYDKEYNGWKIEVIKTQRKSVSLFINDEWITFSSYEKCDKFLNKWRGFTSTKSLKNVKNLDGYKVKFN